MATDKTESPVFDENDPSPQAAKAATASKPAAKSDNFEAGSAKILGIQPENAKDHAANDISGQPIFETTQAQEDNARRVYGQPPVTDVERKAAEYLASDEGKKYSMGFDANRLPELSAEQIVEEGHESPDVEAAAAAQVVKGSGDGVIVDSTGEPEPNVVVATRDGTLKAVDPVAAHKDSKAKKDDK